ncbi:UDP-galactopyranose mutase [Escherichia coli]|uniref:UDP-galactopyranose mutase n=1 Tax=Escherichia coli TaxID=562 RepID=UPI003BF6E9D4
MNFQNFQGNAVINFTDANEHIPVIQHKHFHVETKHTVYKRISIRVETWRCTHYPVNEKTLQLLINIES